MIIPIPSKHNQFKLRVGIRALQPFDLAVRCFDAGPPNTHFIRRRIPFSEALVKGPSRGYREFTLPFPLSPSTLMVEFYDKWTGQDHNFKIETFEVHKMEPHQVWAEPEIHRFIDFAQNFALKAGYVPTGMYDSKDGEFLIQYLPHILDDAGQVMVTPARTNRRTGRLQVAQIPFRTYTIPIRMMVLFHERYHYQIPTRLEKPADLHALKLYLDLGFPRTEALYATTKIFLAHPESVGLAHAIRVRDAKAFIDDYSHKHQLQFNEA